MIIFPLLIAAHSAVPFGLVQQQQNKILFNNRGRHEFEKTIVSVYLWWLVPCIRRLFLAEISLRYSLFDKN